VSNTRKTTEEFKMEVSRLTGSKYEVVGEYKNNKTKVDILHKTCGSIYSVKPNVFLNGKRCPVCRKKREWNDQKFKNFISFHYKDEYEVLSSFKTVHDKVRMKHKKCGNIYEQNVLDILYHQSQCPFCSRKRRGNTDKFKEKLIYTLGPNYELYGDYINNRTNVKLKHLCGNIYVSSPKQLKPCPKCQFKRINIEIRDNLKEYHIDFENDISVALNTVIGFLVAKKIVLEYYSEDDYKFKEKKKENKAKNRLIKLQGLQLLTIPYWHYNDIDRILFILSEFLKKRFSIKGFRKFKKSLNIIPQYKYHKYKKENSGIKY